MFAYPASILRGPSSITWNEVSQWERPLLILPRPMSLKNRFSSGVLVAVNSDVKGEILCSFRCPVVLWLYAPPRTDEDISLFVDNHERLSTPGENQKRSVG